MAFSHPRSRRWLFAPLALLMLTGCLDILEEIWIQADGSARMVLDLGLNKALLGLAGLQGGDPLQETRTRAQQKQAELLQDPDVSRFEFRDFEQAGVHHLVYDFTVRDATRLDEVLQKVLASAPDAQRDQGTQLLFRLERDEHGNYLFLKPPSEAPKDPGTDVAATAGKHVAEALLGNHSYVVRLHGPVILEANGQLDEQRQTVEWRLSLAELLAGSRTEMRAVVQGHSPLWVWAVVVGVPLLLLLLVLAAVRKARRSSRLAPR